MADHPVVELSTKAIEKLNLSPQVKEALRNIQADVADGYRESFVEMVQAIKQQASALERLQNTLNLLVEQIAPQLKDLLPVAIRVAGPDESPDITSALITADPIAAGYTMNQAQLAQALGVSAPEVSVLVKPLGLIEEEQSAVVVRTGKKQQVVNYHPRAVQRFRELIANPPSNLTPQQQRLVARVAKKLIVAPSASPLTQK